MLNELINKIKSQEKGLIDANQLINNCNKGIEDVTE